MINLKIDKAIKKDALKKYANKVQKIHNSMENFKSEGSDFLGWMNWPKEYNKKEFKEIKETAKFCKKEKIEVLVVIGIGGSFLGSKAAIDFINGLYDNNGMEIIFVGTSLSPIDLGQKLGYVKDKKFAINIISKSGTTTEPAIAFRLFQKLLIKKEGINNSNNFIFATTDANKGTLLKQAEEKNWRKFVIPDSIGGRFSVFTAVGLLPMAVAGLDIDKFMKGALVGMEHYSKDDLMKNDAYIYAVTRHILGKKLPVEMYITYEPSFEYLQEWLKQLFAESEGKQGRGVLPTSAVFTRDLHSLGQFIQEGSKVFFETSIDVEEPTMNVKMFELQNDLDNLNYISKMSLNEVNKVAQKGTLDAHSLVGKVPNIEITVFENIEKDLGCLFYFFMRAAAMASYLNGVNPFNQPGVEVYKSNMFKLLGKK